MGLARTRIEAYNRMPGNTIEGSRYAWGGSLSKVAQKFCHLHVHSHYSLLDGVNTIPALVRAARDHGMKSLALTDHGNM
ncbi:MAG TPA: PHP domain-containing protein, partial [Planctomycetes bacterium]|nr:PHP domain-containing protein [Planctomycetota bacterium]